MEHVPCEVPDTVARACLALDRSLGLAYSAIDMVLTPDGRYVFLEINPSGQFGWIESVTGLPLIETLADLLVAGADRASTEPGRAAEAAPPA